ncbi:tRNA-binding protein [Shouchella lehensis]|uniref:tRNA-binding protein n=1 Tax=Shouchella lehensis TaxID=300825 RepID=A0A4Y7WL67_9BACI|nr:tRNA-binding protein [Shouchella lehensis]MBG9783202.1 tRNA-binding protein [Shouchella lehensis]TES49426.1 tRNA-binding protein [Shouchella lehensis]
MATIDTFKELDIRVGTIVHAEFFAEARKPAIKLKVDLGDVGVKASSAQLTKRYETADLIGKQVLAVVNFPSMNIAGFTSEILVLGAVPNKEDVVLIQPEVAVANGTRVG